MDLKEIQNLIKFVAKSGASEVKLEMEDIKITIKTGTQKAETVIVQQTGIPQIPATIPIVPQVPEEVLSTNSKLEKDTSNYIEITSPIIGTFYRRSSPDKPVFVEIGDTVNPETIVCIIEAMKLFNEIEAEVSGEKVLPETLA